MRTSIKGALFVFACAVLGFAFAQDYEEAFTIFIDLNDFHVTQLDNHEFLSSEAIGEHNNVILHLSEDQVRHHQKKHDTFDCHHPAEVHEVVSFIQEAMYERSPIDQAIESNYGGWASKQAAQPAVAASQVDSDEQDAINKFREAYRAYKSFAQPQQLIQAQPAVAPIQAQPLQQKTNPFSSIFSSLIDEDDKKLLGIFQQGSKSLTDTWAPMMENAFSDIFSHTYQNTLTNNDISSTQQQQQQHHHHHHHRHHYEDEEEAQESGEIQQVPQQQVPQQQVSQQQQEEQSNKLTKTEKDALRELVSIVMEKKDKSLLANEVEEIVKELKSQKKSTPMIASDVDEKTVASFSSSTASRPAAPLMTSHIEKAPILSDIIPESVYQKQNIPFSEPQSATKKHVAKRILIPRMEEPGPVIGGGSRPLHIQLPPIDDDVKVGNTRPSAPAQAQIQSASSITTSAGASTTESSKSSTIASANDEALSAPEVVIF